MNTYTTTYKILERLGGPIISIKSNYNLLFPFKITRINLLKEQFTKNTDHRQFPAKN